jgi:hypothetical protein
VLSQRKDVLDILKEAGMLGCKPASIPMDPSLPFGDSESPLPEDVTRYRAMVGKLLYLTVTRSDICFAVGRLSQFMQSPREVHWDGVYHVVRYLKQAPRKGLSLMKNDHFKVWGYSDADYVG